MSARLARARVWTTNLVNAVRALVAVVEAGLLSRATRQLLPRARARGEAIEAGVPALVEARELIAEFHVMIRRKAVAGLVTWIECARGSLVASFASGVTKDEAAVRAAITLPWSNGQTEGQITRLKLVRRQMYGRGKIDLLQARMIGAE